MVRVLANGCFDVLHVGHLDHLEEAKSLGDRLIVSLTLDVYVNKVKGLPVNSWEDRKQMLLALKVVDAVVPSRHCWEAIYEVQPDIFVKGIDYLDSPDLNKARRACDEVGAKLYITNSTKQSSGEIIRRMKAVDLPPRGVGEGQYGIE